MIENKNKHIVVSFIVLFSAISLFIFSFIYYFNKIDYIIFDTLYQLTKCGGDLEKSAFLDSLANMGTRRTIKYTILLCVEIIISFSIIFTYFIVIMKKNTKKLKESTLKYETISATIPGGVYCCKNDSEMTITYISDGLLDLIGYSRDEIKVYFEDKFIKIIYPADRENINITEAEPNTEIHQFQYRIIKKDGGIIWILQSTKYLSLDNKCECYNIIVDITDIKTSERELANSRKEIEAANEMYRIISEQTDNIIFSFDIKQNTVSYAYNLSNIFKYSNDKKDFPYDVVEQQAIHPDDATRFIEFFENIKSGCKFNQEQFRILEIDDNYYWYNLRASTIVNQANEPIKAICILIKADKTNESNDKQLDIFTGFLKFDAFTRQAEEYVCHNRSKMHSLIYIHIDLSEVSDSDERYNIIKKGCTSIRQKLRCTDLICCLGKTDYLLFLKNCSKELSVNKATEISEVYLKLEEAENTHINCNIGLACYPDDDITLENLFEKSNAALDYSIDNQKRITAFNEITNKDECLV